MIENYPVNPLELAFIQHQIKFPKSMAPNIGITVFYTQGEVTFEKLHHALLEVFNYEKTLRTLFSYRDKTWFKSFAKQTTFTELPYETIHITSLDNIEANSDIHEAIQRPFSIIDSYLWRISYLYHNNTCIGFVFVAHHSISDNHSIKLFLSQYTFQYTFGKLHHEHVDYLEYTQELLKSIQSEKNKKAFDFFNDIPQATLEIPFCRNIEPNTDGSSYYLQTNINQIWSKILKSCESLHVTPYMFVSAAWSIAAFSWGNSTFSWGAPLNRRITRKHQHIMGNFSSNVPMSFELSASDTNADVIEKTKKTVLETINYREHYYDPYTHHHTQQMLHVSLDYFLKHKTIKDSSHFFFRNSGSFFPVTCSIEILDEDVNLSIAAQKSCFQHSNEVQVISKYIEHALDFLASNYQDMISNFQSYLYTQTNTEFSFLFPETTIQSIPDAFALFELQAIQYKTRIAIDPESITYEQLHILIQHTRALLREKGVKPQSIITCEGLRNQHMIALFMACLAEHVVFVPIDSQEANERSKYIRNHSQASFQCMVHANGIEIISLDINAGTIFLNNAAYILYTSGSTGHPKGVLVSRNNLHHLISWFIQNNMIDAGDRLLASTSFGFDISILEWLAPLVTGATIILCPKTAAQGFESTHKIIKQQHPTIIQGTPSLFRNLLQQGFHPNETMRLWVGGEAFKAELLPKLSQAKAIYNLYGPTETTIWSTYQKIDLGDKKISVGKPIGNTYMMIANSAMQPVPLGVTGEVYIGGEGVALGYVHNAEQTKQQFISLSIPNHSNTHWYKTGDMGYIDLEHKLHLSARQDTQIKHKGFRIELSEIEHALQACPEIEQAIVLYQEQNIVAHIIPNTNYKNKHTLLEKIAQKIPYFMHPSHIIEWSTFPVNQNNKIDTAKLKQQFHHISKHTFDLTNELQTLLNTYDIDQNTTLSSLGLSSFLVARLITRMEECLNLSMTSIHDLLAHTPATLDAWIHKQTNQQKVEKNKTYTVQKIDENIEMFLKNIDTISQEDLNFLDPIRTLRAHPNEWHKNIHAAWIQENGINIGFLMIEHIETLLVLNHEMPEKHEHISELYSYIFPAYRGQFDYTHSMLDIYTNHLDWIYNKGRIGIRLSCDPSVWEHHRSCLHEVFSTLPNTTAVSETILNISTAATIVYQHLYTLLVEKHAWHRWYALFSLRANKHPKLASLMAWMNNHQPHYGIEAALMPMMSAKHEAVFRSTLLSFEKHEITYAGLDMRWGEPWFFIT